MASGGFADDVTIGDESELWRRIHPAWIVRDDNADGPRVSSAAFDDSPDGTPTSVLLAEVVVKSGGDAAAVMASYEGYALASVTAGQARECRQGIARDPLPDEPAHAYVFGTKTKSVKRCLARHAVWVIPLRTVDSMPP